MWIAVSHGALDVRSRPDFADGVDVIATPVVPGSPLALIGEGATLWRALCDGGMKDNDLTDDERAVLEEMAQAGLVSRNPNDPHVQRALRPPRLSSPLHELVYGLIGHLTKTLTIPAVFIKGPTLHAQGLREREHSGDVDVWVKPSDVDRLSEALRPWGWERRAEVWEGTPIGHSATIVPGEWGCEIDVHRRLPGLTIDDGAAFAELLKHSESATFAGTDVLVPQKDAHAVLLAVHRVRPEIGTGQLARPDEITCELLRGLPADGVNTLQAMGAAVVLRPELEAVFPDASISYEGTPRDWQWRSKSSKVLAYLAALCEVPLRNRPHALLRVIWPTRSATEASSIQRGEKITSPIVARFHRMRLGLLQFFRGLRHR